MQREYHRWYSPALSRDMELLVFGHAGARLLAFPTACGRFYEWEDRGMVGALEEQLERGWLQLFCVDGVDAESWCAGWKEAEARAWRHQEYEHYLLHELLPFTLGRNESPFLIAAGADLGAFHAVDLALRHPQRFGRVLGLSGNYDVRRFVGDHYSGLVYSHNPSHFVSELRSQSRLEALRRVDIVLAVGGEDPAADNNRYLSGILWQKGIGNALRVWEGPAREWSTWQRMLVSYVGGHD